MSTESAVPQMPLPSMQAERAPVDPTLDLEAEIERLKKERNAVILSHYYQDTDIQDMADFVGDSLGLSQQAASTDADVIVFCGVHFMAETAKTLNMGKTVIMPDANAGCSLADRCPPDLFAEWLKQYPDHVVVSYINTSASIKAMSDIICTSTNAVRVVESIPADKKIVFCPDRHLGAWVMKQTGREMVLWPGFCVVHEQFTARKMLGLKREYPDSQMIAHPECEQAVLDMADFIGSTNQLINYVANTKDCDTFVVATEVGVMHQMRKQRPGVNLIGAPPASGCECAICPYMRLNTMEKLYMALRDLQPEITVPEDIAKRSLVPVERMLAIG
jgi:quinolinate synthase